MPSVVYRLVRLLSDTALKIFFTKIEVVGKENLPKNGPVILVGNHKNQFVDSMVVLWGVRRNVSFIIAEVSMHKPIVGPMAKALGAVPVIRPQDKAVPGSGKIIIIDYDAGTITGKGTSFMKDCAQKGCQVIVKGIDPFLVVEVVSDTEITFKKRKPEEGEEAESGKAALEAEGHAFKIIPKLDQNAVFERVHDLLAVDKGLLSIFPEGGSTDRTDLLPLKAGVSIMALGAAVKGANIQIVPYGINYMHGHAFRSKVFVEIGKPLTIDSELVEQYRSGNTRESCDVLMSSIEDSLRGVTINAPNYASLKIMRTARRMFQGSIKLDAKRYLELSRRFAKGYEIWEKDERFNTLSREIAFYLQDAHAQGLSDKEVRDLPPLGTCHTLTNAWIQIFISVIMTILLLPLALPGYLINYPVILRVNKVVKREMAKALAGSRVKVAGRDVAATQTIFIGFKILPLLYTFYSLVALGLMLALWEIEGEEGQWYAWLFDNMTWFLPLAVWLLLPWYSYFSVVMMEKITRRVTMLPFLWIQLQMITSCRNKKSPSMRIRTRRKLLAMRVRALVEVLIPMVPGWADERIISVDMLKKSMRDSDHSLHDVAVTILADTPSGLADDESKGFRGKGRVHESLLGK